MSMTEFVKYEQEILRLKDEVRELKAEIEELKKEKTMLIGKLSRNTGDS